MDLDHLREILELVAQCDISEVEIEEENLRVVVRKHAPVQAMPQQITYAAPPAYAPAHTPAPSAEVAPAPAAPVGKQVHAPIVGTFYTSSSPDAPAFVKVGDKVKTGDVLCIIEAMKLMNEIESEVSGTITQVLVENGTAVEYDQPLFVVDPN